MEMKTRQLDDPHVLELYADLAQVIEWAADDPRLAGVADRLVSQFEAQPVEAWQEGARLPDGLAALLDQVFLDSVPAARRMLDLLEERGWTGWTNIRPITSEG
jgi:hypothetical protein